MDEPLLGHLDRAARRIHKTRSELFRLALHKQRPPRNQGLVDALLACPERDWFQPIPSKSTLSIEPPS